MRLVFTPLKKHTVVLVLSHSKNPQSCVPIGESGFAVLPCQFPFLSLSSQFPFLISHFLVIRFSVSTSQFLVLTSQFLVLSSHFIVSTSLFSVPTSPSLAPTSQSSSLSSHFPVLLISSQPYTSPPPVSAIGAAQRRGASRTITIFHRRMGKSLAKEARDTPAGQRRVYDRLSVEFLGHNVDTADWRRVINGSRTVQRPSR